MKVKTHAGIRARSLMTAIGYGIGRTLGRSFIDLSECSESSVTLYSGGKIETIKPFYWKRHEDRIFGSYNGVGAVITKEEVINEFLNDPFHVFRPVIAYRVKNATLIDGSLYSGGYRRELRSAFDNKQIGLNLSGPVGELDEAALVSTVAGSTWWGHWVLDELPTQMLAMQFAPPIAFLRSRKSEEGEYRALFGVDEPSHFSTAFFKSIVIIDEHAQNPDKVRRYHRLRESVKHLPSGSDRIYLKRGNTGLRRNLLNEEDLCEKLTKHGFDIVDLSQHSVEELVKKCKGAKLVVSIEGSHLSQLVYLMDDFSCFVILSPPHRVISTIADVATFCNISSGMFICNSCENSLTDFYLDLNELLYFIDDTESYAHNNRPRLEKFVSNVIAM